MKTTGTSDKPDQLMPEQARAAPGGPPPTSHWKPFLRTRA